AAQEGKDVKDEDVQIEIQENIQDLIDKRVLGIYASNLRNELKEILNQNKNVVKTHDDEVAKAKEAEQTAYKGKVESKFQDVFKKKEFFGITPELNRLKATFKK